MTIRCHAYVDRLMMALFFAMIVTTSCYVAASISGASYIKTSSTQKAYAAKEPCSNNHKCKQHQSDFILSDLVTSDTKTKSHHDNSQTDRSNNNGNNNNNDIPFVLPFP